MDCIRKTHISFIRCMLPVPGAGKYDLNDPVSAGKASNIAAKMDVPFLRDQLKRAQVLDAVRLHRQGSYGITEGPPFHELEFNLVQYHFN